MSDLRLAKRKVREAGFKVNKVDVTKGSFRFRQFPPSKFQKGSFRTLDVGRPGGLKLIIARPLGKKTTKVQSVVVEK